MSGSLAKGIARFFRARKTDPITEASEQFLNKQAKIDTALDGVIVNDLHHISNSERDAVERYREKTVFGNDTPPKKKKRRMGDFIVCDDYSRNDWLPWVATLLALIVLSGLAWFVLSSSDSPKVEHPEWDIHKFVPTEVEKQQASDV